MERGLTVDRLGDAIRPHAGNYDELIAMIGNASIVLLGEATHGTHEFYQARAEITKRLIAERDFSAVCIEGDWPDAYRVNRYVRGAGDDAEAVDSLAGFARFPTWMWRNAEVLDFVAWLREYNDSRRARGRATAGFYGLDLYSMYASIDAVITYLDGIDPEAAGRARERYGCLQSFSGSPEQYARATEAAVHRSCRAEVLAQLLEIQRHAADYAKLDGRVAQDQYFYVEQNARIVANAEAYYRLMMEAGVSTWNLRDGHMVETLEHLLVHLGRHQPAPKAVVWAHNSHVGDARATSMGARGETNIGAIVRSRYGPRVFSLGFTTFKGTVTAASDWHAPAERKAVRPARSDSYEWAFHRLGVPNFFLPVQRLQRHLGGLPDAARERAIGVIYRPDTELQSHYFTARIRAQFDALYHFDVTRAVEPLERSARWEEGEPPETYPSGE